MSPQSRLPDGPRPVAPPTPTPTLPPAGAWPPLAIPANAICLTNGEVQTDALLHLRPRLTRDGCLATALRDVAASLAPAAQARLHAQLHGGSALAPPQMRTLWRWAAGRQDDVTPVNTLVLDRCALATSLWHQAESELRAALARGDDGVVDLVRALADRATERGLPLLAVCTANARIRTAQAFCRDNNVPEASRLAVLLLAWSLPDVLTPKALRDAFDAAHALAEAHGLQHPEARLHLLRAAGSAFATPARRPLWAHCSAAYVGAAAAAERRPNHDPVDLPAPAVVRRFAELVRRGSEAEAQARADAFAAPPWPQDDATTQVAVFEEMADWAPDRRKVALEALRHPEGAALLWRGVAAAQAADESLEQHPRPGATARADGRRAALRVAYSFAHGPRARTAADAPHAEEFAALVPSAAGQRRLADLLALPRSEASAAALRGLGVFLRGLHLREPDALPLLTLAAHRDDLTGADMVALTDAVTQLHRHDLAEARTLRAGLLQCLLVEPLPAPRYLLRPLLFSYFGEHSCPDHSNEPEAAVWGRMDAVLALLRHAGDDEERGGLCALMDVVMLGLRCRRAAVTLGRHAAKMTNAARLALMRLAVQDPDFSLRQQDGRLALMAQASEAAQAAHNLLARAGVAAQDTLSDQALRALDRGKGGARPRALAEDAAALRRRRQALRHRLAGANVEALADVLRDCTRQLADWCAQLGHTSADGHVDDDDARVLRAAHATLMAWQQAPLPQRASQAPQRFGAALIWQALQPPPRRLPQAENMVRSARFTVFLTTLTGAAASLQGAACCRRATLDDVARLLAHLETGRPLKAQTLMRLQAGGAGAQA